MWVRSTARGTSSPSLARTVSSEDSGPGSTSAPSTSQQPITRSRPRCSTSISRIAAELIERALRVGLRLGGRSGGEAAFGLEHRPQPRFEVARLVAELTFGLLVARPEG